MFKVIPGKLEETLKKESAIKEKRLDLHIKNFYNKIVSDSGYDVVSGVWHGIRYVSLCDIDRMYLEDLEDLMEDILLIKDILALFTPHLFLRYFPIDKYFKGGDFAKDYWSTQEYLSCLNKDYPVSVTEIDNFLWNYLNKDLMHFSIKELLTIDRIRKFNGQPSLAQDFADAFNIDTYTINREDGYILNNRTRKVEKIKKQFPRYLKRIK